MDLGYRGLTLEPVSRIWRFGLGSRVNDSGFRGLALGARICRAWGLGCIGFRVLG